MKQEAVEVLFFALISALLAVIIRQPEFANSEVIAALAVLVSLVLVPRIITYGINWQKLGGTAHYLEFHQQGGSPTVALVAAWPSFLEKSLIVRGRSFRILKAGDRYYLDIRGSWQSHQLNFRKQGPHGRVIYYFYSGSEAPVKGKAYPVPDGMTAMNLHDADMGTGYFFDKLDEANVIARHDTAIVRLGKDELRKLRSNDPAVRLPRLYGVGPKHFDAFQKAVSDALNQPDGVAPILGKKADKHARELIEHFDRLEPFRNSPEANSPVHKELRKRTENADARFSKFRVSACVETSSNQMFYGVNLENSSYPAGICAESSAVAQMVSSVGPAEIKQVSVYSPENRGNLFPCGVCLQRISAYATKNARVTIFSEERVTWSGEFSQLLSSAFHLDHGK